MASKGPELEAHVMGHPKGGAQESHEGQLGACPFSHRVLLTLEEKEVPYLVNFVDVKQKPAWVSKVNPAGTLPILRDLALNQFVVDSDTIVDYLEEKYAHDEKASKKPLGKSTDTPHAGQDLTATFMAFLKAPGEGGQEREELKQQLQAINDSLSDQHPYMGGADVNAWDMALAPRLYMARVGCKEIKGWDFCMDGCDEVRAYLHRMVGRHSWRNTASFNYDSIVEDLRSKLSAA